MNFTPDRDGYYRVAWQSSQGADVVRDRLLPPVKAETYVFVATNTTTESGLSPQRSRDRGRQGYFPRRTDCASDDLSGGT